MFTKPVNIPVPLTEIKQRPKKKWFNGYVLCFLFLILCILLVLAYRIEVKIIQQNLRKNYDDYIAEMKKDLLEEENLLIKNLGKNYYDTKGNGEDYDIINVQIIDDDQSVTRTYLVSSSTEKTEMTPSIKDELTTPQDSEKSTMTASIKDDIATPQDSEESTDNDASEVTSIEDTETSADDSSGIDSSEEEGTTLVPTSKTDAETTKVSENTSSTPKPTEETTQSSTDSSKSNNISSTVEATTKAVKIEEYVTKSSQINGTTGNKTKTDEYYDPKKSQIVVIQVQQDTDYPDVTRTTDKNKKYYHLPKDMFDSANDKNKVPSNTNSKTTEYQTEDSYPDSSEEDTKTPQEESDPANENIENFHSHVENINKIISNIHKEVSKQIDKDMADMQKDLPPLNVDLDFEVDPFYDRSKINQKKSTSKNVANGDDPYLIIEY